MKTHRPLLTTPPQLQRRDAVRLQRAVLATQPWVGLGGLVLSAVVFFALALGLGNTATSLLVLGPITVFAVSGVAMIGFWWNDWPGSRLNKPWTGLTDTALIIVGGSLADRLNLRLRRGKVARDHLILEPCARMGTVAEGFVLGLPAAAQGQRPRVVVVRRNSSSELPGHGNDARLSLLCKSNRRHDDCALDDELKR